MVWPLNLWQCYVFLTIQKTIYPKKDKIKISSLVDLENVPRLIDILAPYPDVSVYALVASSNKGMTKKVLPNHVTKIVTLVKGRDSADICMVAHVSMFWLNKSMISML